MRRIVFYLLIGLLAFGISSIVAFNFYRKAEGSFNVVKTKEAVNETQTKGNVGYGSASASGNSLIYNQPNQVSDVQKKPQISCTDKEILPVWNQLKKDKEFRKRSEEFYMDADCSKTLDVQAIDLNDDGQKELILWGKSGNLCGGTGNCDMWIYEKKNGIYKQILQSNAYNDGEDKWFEVNKVKANGYRNILLKGHATASETTEHFYEFNGKRYAEKKCLYVNYFSNEEEPSITTCEEAWKR